MTEKKTGRAKGQADFRKLPPGHINPREGQTLVNRYLHGMGLADAVMAAGYECTTRQSAASLGAKIIKKHRSANSELLHALERVGVSADELARGIADGLCATESVKVGEDAFEDRPDHKTRHKFLETAIDITGARAAKRVEIAEMSFEERLAKIIEEDEANGEVRRPW